MLHVTREEEGLVEVWTVDRPAAANALDRATIERLCDAIEMAESNASLRAIVLAATSREGASRPVFLAGADLREVAAMADEGQARRFAGDVMHALARLERMPAVVIAAIAGDVYGGGCEVVSACDLRVAEQGIAFSFKQTRIGVASGWGGTTRLVRLVGLGAAKRLLLTGAPCGAEEALRVGLVDEIVERGCALERARAIAREVVAGAPAAVAAMKVGLLEALEVDRETSYARELDRFVATFRTRDHKEALRAMKEKRTPTWRGE
jgi:enoyl-CoA hydratase/carnithine racemase